MKEANITGKLSIRAVKFYSHGGASGGNWNFPVTFAYLIY